MDDAGTNIRTPVIADIIHLILNHLYDSKELAALARCSLVCRAWLYPSRRYLFRTIALHTDSKRFDLHAFADFLTTCSDARVFLQNLSLDSGYFEDIPDEMPGVDVKDLLAILDAGSNIRRLSLRDVPCYGDLGDSLPRHSLERLYVYRWFELPQGDLLDVLIVTCLFERIDTLEFSLNAGNGYQAPNGSIDRIEHHVQNGFFPSIHSLHVSTSTDKWPAQSLYQMIQRSCVQDPDTLRQITFQAWGTWECIVRFCRFICLSDVRFHLRELKFHPGGGWYQWPANIPVSDWSVLDLSRLEQMEHITLVFDHTKTERRGSEGVFQELHPYTLILRKRPLPALRRLTLKFCNTTGGYITLRRSYLDRMRNTYRKPVWDAFDSALQALPKSIQVVFDFTGPWNDLVQPDAIDQCLREVVPLTHAKGLVLCQPFA
ncbi:hypothetical protein C8Q73DRAFT_703591 [Cubamyces lactineus]|nr:hypothetical protein C8Q73DRAFT_703591 [Cubamyces lactineus]